MGVANDKGHPASGCMHTEALDDFLRNLEHIPWFEQLGKPSTRDHEVFRIHSWAMWPGPENPGSAIQAAYYTCWYENVFGKGAFQAQPDEELWRTIHDRVIALAQGRVPYDAGQDVWYGPNAAIWSAAYVAALVGCTIRKGGKLQVPRDQQWSLANEWSWFSIGHWPCTYYWSWGYADLASVERTSDLKVLVVF